MQLSNNKFYNEEFYFRKNYPFSNRSAREIIPIIIEIFKPESVVDLGRGSGIWLNVFKELKVLKILGLDFHDSRHLLKENEFIKIDLRKKLTLNKKFDLAISLEVAEHIEPTYSDLFVDNLTRLSDQIIFSAAIPNQEGENHINEQWNLFWVDKFEKRGFVALDLIRPRILLNNNIGFDYRQNIICFIKKSILDRNPSKFLPHFNKKTQLLHRKCLFKQKSIIVRLIYRINNQIFNGLFDSVLDKIILNKFFGDIASSDFKEIAKVTSKTLWKEKESEERT